MVALSVPQATYQAGARGPFTANAPVGASQAIVTFTQVGWPQGMPMAKATLEVTYDGGTTWGGLGGLTVAAMPAGTVDPYIGLVTTSTLKANLPQPANANTKVKVSLEVMQPTTTAITLEVA